MNENKLKRLFESARRETAPAPPPDFAADALRAVHCAPETKSAEPSSVCDQLNLFFPRIAFAALVVVALCLAADFGLTAAGVPDLGDGAAQISAQWFLTPNGF